MRGTVRVEKLLMIVKAYPTPSKKYGETVCTGAIRLRDMSWVRLYPYPFRISPNRYRFKKWDVVELPIEKNSRDPRPDSYRPFDLTQLKHITHIGTGDDYWTPRMDYIHKTAAPSVEEFIKNALRDDGTWGPSLLPIPVSNKGVKVTWKHQGKWTPEHEAKLERARQKAEGHLFDPVKYQKLKPKPYLFRLTFRDLTGDEYTFPILDWEIYQLYFNSRERAKNDEEALEKVRHKIEDQIFSYDREVHIILGSMRQNLRKKHQFAVDGFIWPKRRIDQPLFDLG